MFCWHPGAIVALLISGNVHEYSQLILYAVNLAFFSFFTYFCGLDIENLDQPLMKNIAFTLKMLGR